MAALFATVSDGELPKVLRIDGVQDQTLSLGTGGFGQGKLH